MKGFLKRVLLLICLFLFLNCDNSVIRSGELIDFIPENTSAVFNILDFGSLETDIRNNGLFSEFKATAPYTFFSEKSLLHHLLTSERSLLCINSNEITDYTFITKQTTNLFEIDSLQNKSIETLSYNNYTLQKISVEGKQVFSVIKDSVFILSSSLQIIKNILAGKVEKDPVFLKVYSLKNTAELSTIINTRNIRLNDSLKINFASWAVLDVKVLPDMLTATGVVLPRDKAPQLLSVFEGLVPQQNNIAKVTPLDALSVVSFTFNDIEIFQKNIQRFRETKNPATVETGLFESVIEVGSLEFSQGKAIVLKSIDPSLTNEALTEYITQKDSFKQIILNEFNEPDLFTNVFAPLLDYSLPKYAFQLGDFFVFSENETIAHNIITAYLNNNCLAQSTYFKDSASQLSSTSSLLIMKLNGNFANVLTGFFNTNTSTLTEELRIGSISSKKYPLAVLQFIYERDFAHINLVCKEASPSNRSSGIVSQLFSIKLEEELLRNPQFFTNHRTNGKDIVVQDVTNKLYFISSGGKVLWTKILDGPILGDIQEVDILRNRKKQLAFVTKNTFYVLDRNGRNVTPFPLVFKDDITQALSVFDYENNRKYRFVITQGNEIFMYDSKGKTVEGFKFKKAKSNIVLPPQHIRIINKDYVLIAEENGKLNILNRIGKSRISVSNSFDFSEMPIAKEGNKFVVITKNNSKVSISQKGKVTTQKLNVTGYWFTIKGKIKVTLDDNLMRINGKLVELPYGLYTTPKIYTANHKTYITITETQENKVYVYTKSGEILPGFPVFGTSSTDIGDANKNGKLNFLVKGGDKEILLFELR